MAMYTKRSMDPAMALFLRGRVGKVQEDCELAALLLSGVVDVDDPHAKDYLKLILHEGNPRISWTTRSRVDKALGKLDNYAARDAFNFYRAGGHRVMSRPSALAQELTGIKDGRALDVFTNAVAAELTRDDIKVVVVRGKDITHYYNYKRHCKCVSTGELSASCMRYDYEDHRFKMYEDAASLALMKCGSCGGVRARTLLWENEKGKYYDRVYGNTVAVRQIEVWAGNEGYEPIWGGRYAESGKSVRIALPEAAESYKSAPYLDTLFYWCRECNDLRTKRCRRKGHAKHVVKLRGTQGTDHERWWGVCPTCNGARNIHGECGNEVYCGICRMAHCAANRPMGEWLWTCPGGHVFCYSCREIRHADDPCGCRPCNHCHRRYRERDWAVTHGRCGNCFKVKADLNIPYARYATNYHRMQLRGTRGQCQFCGTAFGVAEVKRHDHANCPGCASLGWGNMGLFDCPYCDCVLEVSGEVANKIGSSNAIPGGDHWYRDYLGAMHALRDDTGGVRIE